MQYIGSLEAAGKHISAKIFEENLHTSVKILQICMDFQDSEQRSLQIRAEKILQICTDLQRSKTWVLKIAPFPFLRLVKPFNVLELKKLLEFSFDISG